MTISDAKTPGVYIHELPSGVRTISGASTSIPAFLGIIAPTKYLSETGKKEQEDGRLYRPFLVRSWSEFAERYGVGRMLEFLGELDVQIKGGKAQLADYHGEPWEMPESPEDAKAQRAALEAYMPLAEAVYGFFANGGSSCYIVPLKLTGATMTDFKAAVKGAELTGLEGLKTVPDVSMVAVPDLAVLAAADRATITDEADKKRDADAKSVMGLVAQHCTEMQNRVAILDAVNGYGLPARGAAPDLGLDKKYQEFAALYYPWVRVPGLDGQPRLVPASGHIAGVYARTDAERGVFKAPANEALQGVLDLAVNLTDDQQGGLNEKHVNCLRAFPGRGIRVWGARTLAVDSRDFRYINVRRLTCFLADSIKNSTNWAVFEPNNDTLWATLRQTVTTFLTDQWRQGALLGRTPAEAFYVVCDGTNNPPDSIDSGHVICDIGIAPVRPAEFVHFQIKQIAGQSGQGA